MKTKCLFFYWLKNHDIDWNATKSLKLLFTGSPEIDGCFNQKMFSVFINQGRFWKIEFCFKSSKFLF